MLKRRSSDVATPFGQRAVDVPMICPPGGPERIESLTSPSMIRGSTRSPMRTSSRTGGQIAFGMRTRVGCCTKTSCRSATSDLHDLDAVGRKDGELPCRDRDVVRIGRVRCGTDGEQWHVQDPWGGGEDDRVQAGSDYVLANLKVLPVGDQCGLNSIGSVIRVRAPFADLDRDVDRDFHGPGEADFMQESLGVLDLPHFGSMSEDACRLAPPDLTKDRLVVSALDDRLEALRRETGGVGLHGGVLEETHLLHPREKKQCGAKALEGTRTDRAKRGLAASPQLFVRLPVSAKDRILEVDHALPPDHGCLNLRQRPCWSWDRPGILSHHLHLDGADFW